MKHIQLPLGCERVFSSAPSGRQLGPSVGFEIIPLAVGVRPQTARSFLPKASVWSLLNKTNICEPFLKDTTLLGAALLYWVFVETGAHFGAEQSGLWIVKTGRFLFQMYTFRFSDMAYRSLLVFSVTSSLILRQRATSRKVTGSIPDGVIGIFHYHNPSDRNMTLESTQPLTEMSTRNTS